MYLVGVDLAWSARSPTGLAVLDDEGRLVHVSACRSDAEIVQALQPYTEGDCVVALDAPLLVRNATGNRPAETALNRDFARFEAGAHPVNTGKAEFRDGSRAGELVRLLGLDPDPRSGRARRAIEVYPHAATVALFRLGRTLKYKNKTGRDLDSLRAEMLVLIGLVEGLSAAEPALITGPDAVPSDDAALDTVGWAALRAGVEGAVRKSHLRVVEDQVDAVLCAYVALLAVRRPDRLTTYGDPETGAIVTPTLPADLTPSPRGARVVQSGDDPGAAVRRYAELQPRLRPVADGYVALLTSILDDAGINYLTVTGRAKSVASFAAKTARTVSGPDGVRPAFADPLHDIADQVGVRVITYVHSDVQAVADLLAEEVVVHDDRDLGEETAGEGRFGYASRHLQIGVDGAGDALDEAVVGALHGHRAQVQIRTVLQHAWAEFEHDIRYKGSIPDEHRADFDRRFTLAAGLLELADREFSTIRDRLREPAAQAASGEQDAPEDLEDPRITPRELAAFLAGQYADAGWSRTDHYAWIAGLVLQLGITSLAELGDVVRSVDGAALAARMDYRYPPGAVRRLDDALLWTYGETYVALAGNAHRVSALQSRLRRLRED